VTVTLYNNAKRDSVDIISNVLKPSTCC